MSEPGTQTRERFIRNMEAIAVGATLSRRRRWVVIKQKHFDCSVDLTLRSGKRTVRINVGISIRGPDLWEIGLNPALPAPQQRGLL